MTDEERYHHAIRGLRFNCRGNSIHEIDDMIRALTNEADRAWDQVFNAHEVVSTWVGSILVFNCKSCGYEGRYVAVEPAVASIDRTMTEIMAQRHHYELRWGNTVAWNVHGVDSKGRPTSWGAWMRNIHVGGVRVDRDTFTSYIAGDGGYAFKQAATLEEGKKDVEQWLRK